MKLELRFKILCGYCHKDMEQCAEQGDVHIVRCLNPDCKKPSNVYVVDG